ncbi:MAG: Lipopolysaccharide export system ATP-binding protein LptB [Dehalococcoidia bacterium]|nr:Lipopolysaccharide export system ATP-binding protein LptB [Bacillota bacterium]
MSVLRIENLTRRFGGLVALSGVNLELRENEILGLIGPNGAGKTTLVNVISGIYLPNSGRIIFDGKDVTESPAHIRCRLGIGRTFQIIQPNQNLNVLENVMVGSLFGQGAGLKEARRKAQEICQFLGLSRIERDITRLTVLEIKKMEMAHALATQPKVLLLDEIMTGLNIDEAREVIELVRKIRDQGMTICVIEHMMRIIKELTDRVLVLDRGEVIAEGLYEEVSNDPRVISAYLGEEE